jgi:hypothetical protein
MHNFGAQGVFGPDGLFYDWYDGPVGRHNDRHFMTESLVNDQMRNLQLNANINYWIYN